MEGRDPHLSLEEPLRPFRNRTGLRDEDDPGPVEGKRPHVLRVVTVIADGNADFPKRRLIDRRPAVAGSVVASLVEAGLVRDVDHPRPPEKRPVGVDDRRTVVCVISITLEEVEHDDDTEVCRPPRERLGGRAGNGLRPLEPLRGRRLLGVEGLESELREADHPGALISGS